MQYSKSRPTGLKGATFGTRGVYLWHRQVLYETEMASKKPELNWVTASTAEFNVVVVKMQGHLIPCLR